MQLSSENVSKVCRAARRFAKLTMPDRFFHRRRQAWGSTPVMLKVSDQCVKTKVYAQEEKESHLSAPNPVHLLANLAVCLRGLQGQVTRSA